MVGACRGNIRAEPQAHSVRRMRLGPKKGSCRLSTRRDPLHVPYSTSFGMIVSRARHKVGATPGLHRAPGARGLARRLTDRQRSQASGDPRRGALGDSRGLGQLF
jgi:hypothetical protein